MKETMYSKCHKVEIVPFEEQHFVWLLAWAAMADTRIRALFQREFSIVLFFGLIAYDISHHRKQHVFTAGVNNLGQFFEKGFWKETRPILYTQEITYKNSQKRKHSWRSMASSGGSAVSLSTVQEWFLQAQVLTQRA